MTNTNQETVEVLLQSNQNREYWDTEMIKIQSFHTSVSCLPQNSDTRDSIPHLIQKKKKKKELDKVIPPADGKRNQIGEKTG